MKNQFQAPEVEVINFDMEDVLTASAGLTDAVGSGDSDTFDKLFGNN